MKGKNQVPISIKALTGVTKTSSGATVPSSYAHEQNVVANLTAKAMKACNCKRK